MTNEEHVVKPIYKEQPKLAQPEPVAEVVPQEIAERMLDEHPTEYYQDMLKKGDINRVVVSWSQDPLFFKLASWFGMEPDDWLNQDSMKKLEQIADWAIKKAGSRKAVDVLTEIKTLQRRLPSSGLQKPLTILVRYIGLLEQEVDLKREMKLYESEKGGGEK